jgi:hypothetical protein
MWPIRPSPTHPPTRGALQPAAATAQTLTRARGTTARVCGGRRCCDGRGFRRDRRDFGDRFGATERGTPQGFCRAAWVQRSRRRLCMSAPLLRQQAAARHRPVQIAGRRSPPRHHRRPHPRLPCRSHRLRPPVSPVPAAGIPNPDAPHFTALATIPINHRPRSVPSPLGTASSVPSHPCRRPHLQELVSSPQGSALPANNLHVPSRSLCSIPIPISYSDLTMFIFTFNVKSYLLYPCTAGSWQFQCW